MDGLPESLEKKKLGPLQPPDFSRLLAKAPHSESWPEKVLETMMEESSRWNSEGDWGNQQQLAEGVPQCKRTRGHHSAKGFTSERTMEETVAWTPQGRNRNRPGNIHPREQGANSAKAPSATNKADHKGEPKEERSGKEGKEYSQKK
eukprot:g53431.t1